MGKYWLCVMIGAFSLSGCGNFLDEYSQDLVVVKTVKDLDEVLLGDVYLPNKALTAFSKTSFVAWMNFLDDDINTVITRRGSDKWLSTKWLYGYSTWQQDVGRAVDGGGNVGNDDSPWVETYYRINIINIILDKIKDISLKNESEETAAERIQGEAHFQRALFYFFLVNLYAEAYQPDRAEKQLGIPLKLSSYVENSFHRNSLAEIYGQIVKDLQAAEVELSRNPQMNPSYRASYEAVMLLLSRVYLYMQDWENAKRAAREFLKVRDRLCSVAGMDASRFFMDWDNGEIVFSQSCLNLVKVLTAEGGDFCVAQELYDLYGENDLRKEFFFHKNVMTDSIALHRKYPMLPGKNAVSDAFTLRVAEGYLNMAEACAMLDETEANEWLNRLRRMRIADYADVQYSGGELIRQIRDERRKELCFEGHRWFDLRRYSVCVKYPFKKTIDRVFAQYSQDNNYNFNTANLFRLEKDDLSYLFRIPQAIRDFHSDMTDNQRAVRKSIATIDADGNLVDNDKN